MPTAPLLEEKGDGRRHALVADGPDPFRLHRACAGARLAADDHPAYACQGQGFDRAKQWLYRQKADLSRGVVEVVDTRSARIIFNPSRMLANLAQGHLPWYRAGRPISAR